MLICSLPLWQTDSNETRLILLRFVDVTVSSDLCVYVGRIGARVDGRVWVWASVFLMAITMSVIARSGSGKNIKCCGCECDRDPTLPSATPSEVEEPLP